MEEKYRAIERYLNRTGRYPSRVWADKKSSCEANSTGILGAFRACLAKQMPLAVEIDKDLEFCP